MSGVNQNMIQWVKQGATYYCFFISGGIELFAEFTGVEHSFIDKLDFHAMLKA